MPRPRTSPPATAPSGPEPERPGTPRRQAAVRQPARQRRDRGDGSIATRRKADGTTVYDVYFGFPDPTTGEVRRTCTRGFATSTGASRFLRSQTSQVDAGSYVPPSRLALADYLEQWLDALRLAAQTVGSYRVRVRVHLVPHQGHLTLSEITPLHLNAMYNALERTGDHRVRCHSQPCGRKQGTGPLSRIGP